MEVWHGVKVYSEESFDRKLRRESKEILFEEVTAHQPGRLDELVTDQLFDLIEGLGLSKRSEEALRLRVQGLTLRETAEEMGVSRQRVERIWKRIQERFRSNHASLEEQMVRGRVPHYGWQEVFLNSMRQRGSLDE